MKELSLRELLRNPKSIKKLTAAGQTVRITDQGKPLWLVRTAPATGECDDESERVRREWTDEELDRLLAEPTSKVSAGKLLSESRR